MKAGKISIRDITRFIIPYTGTAGNDVIIGPKPGFDSGIVNIDGILISASTDPITATSELIGRWVVYITSNDVLASGAIPKWLLLTLVLPINYDFNNLETIMKDVSYALNRINSTLIGGHTEFTPTVKFPLAVGTCIGRVKKLFNPNEVEEGDKIVLFGDPGREGVYIIYNEYQKELEPILSDDDVKYLWETPDKISIYNIVSKFSDKFWDKLKFMHDPTEGGILNGMYEMSIAIGRAINMFDNSLTTSETVERICNKLNINPFRLLSSGSLLAIIEEDGVDDAISLGGRVVGEVVVGEGGRVLVNNKPITLSNLEKDEIWKIIS